MYTIWLYKTETSYVKYKNCLKFDLFKEIELAKKAWQNNRLEITKNTFKPLGNLLPTCATTTCALCPKSTKKACPLYKLVNKVK